MSTLLNLKKKPGRLGQYLVVVSLLLIVLAFVPSSLTAQEEDVAPAQNIPTFTIVSVVADESVTIETNNFPANQNFDVRMGPIGTLGIDGTLVTTTPSEEGGTFTATYAIPEHLHGARMIAIRLESPQGFFAYNWFFNRTVDADEDDPVGIAPRAEPALPTDIPTFTIASVVADESVTIETNNFPANQNFNVRMGPMGTRGIDGTLVTTTPSEEGGTFTATYAIPEHLHGARMIAIRLESPQGYFAYNWFFNRTTDVEVEGDGENES
jgi:hypothetical protein